MNAVEHQQRIFESLEFDFGRYTENEYGYLQQRIAYAVFGPPAFEQQLNTEVLIGYTVQQKDVVTSIFNAIYKQRMYVFDEKELLVSVVTIVCCRPQKHVPLNSLHKLPDGDGQMIFTVPVFGFLKCAAATQGFGCCVYIDTEARVYQTWTDYLTENLLPRCVMVVPKDGRYQGQMINDELHVLLDVVPSPALGAKARILSGADTTSTVASVGSLGVIGVSLFTPVAPVVMAGAAVTTVATGIYGLFRSSQQLHDRHVHSQSIGLESKEARACYLNIGASTLSVASGAATKVLGRLAAQGTNATKAGQVVATSVNVLNKANLALSAGNVANSLANIIIKMKKGDKPTTMELFHFTSSVLFFTHAVMSAKTAQRIIDEAQEETFSKYVQSLGKTRRRVWNKRMREACTEHGSAAGKAYVIRSIRVIQNRSHLDQVMSPNELPEQFIPKKESAVSAGPSGGAADALLRLSPNLLMTIGRSIYEYSQSGTDAGIVALVENYSRELYDKFVDICFSLCECLPEDLRRCLSIISHKDIVGTVVQFASDHVLKPCLGRDVAEAVEQFFTQGRIRKEKIRQLMQALRRRIDRALSSAGRARVACARCGGCYFT